MTKVSKSKQRIYSVNSDKRAEKRAAAGWATVRGNVQNVVHSGKSKRSKTKFSPKYKNNKLGH